MSVDQSGGRDLLAIAHGTGIIPEGARPPGRVVVPTELRLESGEPVAVRAGRRGPVYRLRAGKTVRFAPGEPATLGNRPVRLLFAVDALDEGRLHRLCRRIAGIRSDDGPALTDAYTRCVGDRGRGRASAAEDAALAPAASSVLREIRESPEPLHVATLRRRGAAALGADLVRRGLAVELRTGHLVEEERLASWLNSLDSDRALSSRVFAGRLSVSHSLARAALEIMVRQGTVAREGGLYRRTAGGRP